MKTLKFYEPLPEKILSGQKSTTWRLFDDKNLSEGETVQLVNKDTGEPFGMAKLLRVNATTFGNLSEQDWDGHERFASHQAMLDTYSTWYGRKLDDSTPLKAIKFELVN